LNLRCIGESILADISGVMLFFSVIGEDAIGHGNLFPQKPQEASVGNYGKGDFSLGIPDEILNGPKLLSFRVFNVFVDPKKDPRLPESSSSDLLFPLRIRWCSYR
jgi:hypothetical protein